MDEVGNIYKLGFAEKLELENITSEKAISYQLLALSFFFDLAIALQA